MNQKLAQTIFVVLNVLSVCAVAYVVYDFFNVITAIEVEAELVPFDSGTYYFLLMSVFWVLSVIQYVGLKNKHAKMLKFGNQILVFWFVMMILLANIIPYYLVNKLEVAGYMKVKDPREISRVAKGESSFYIRKTDSDQLIMRDLGTPTK